jgi:hypothetical protein
MAKYSGVSIYSSSFHVWFSIERVSKYRYRNIEYLSTTKSSNTLNPPSKEDLNTRNRVYKYITRVLTRLDQPQHTSPANRPHRKLKQILRDFNTLSILRAIEQVYSLKEYLNAAFIFCSIKILVFIYQYLYTLKTKQSPRLYSFKVMLFSDTEDHILREFYTICHPKAY